MKTCCTVVIGHVDHGKTALVCALTGTDTDRLPEEKARGLSITLGFAHCTYPSGIIDFVDAPGHKDFIQAMVSGASGAQAALIVISMNEGIAAQTIEHLCIAGLLGISNAVIAITKSDLVPATEHAKRLADIKAALSQTPYANAPLVACSAQSGDGIEMLHHALENLLKHQASTTTAPNSFLPIDSVFSVEGQGTIVTGTLLGNDIFLETKLVLQPAGRDISLRSLQSRGKTREHIQAGERMAANLRGISANEIARGAVLCVRGSGQPSHIVDAHLELLPAHAKSLKHMQEVRVLFATSSAVAQVRVFKGQDGPQKFVQLRFKKPITCFAGQVGVLRRLSPPETIGKAVFLDPQAEPAKASDVARVELLEMALKADKIAIGHALCAKNGGAAKVSDIARIARLEPDSLLNTMGTSFSNLTAGWIASEQSIKEAREVTLNALFEYHQKHPLQSKAPRASLQHQPFSPVLLQCVEDALVAEGLVHREANMLALADHDPMTHLNDAQREVIREFEATYQQAGLTEPTNGNLPNDDQTADIRQLLLDTNRLVSLQNIALNQTLIFHKDAVANAALTLAQAFPNFENFTTSQARTALGTTRRVIVPLLEHFDSCGITIRQGNIRQIAALISVSQITVP